MSSMLTRNVGTIDRVARALLGVVILAFAFTGPKSAWGYLGFIPLLTAALGTCPLYTVLGINSCGVRRA